MHHFLPGELISLDLQSSSREETSSQWTEYEDGALLYSDSIRSDFQNASPSNEKNESLPSQAMQCRVCKFRTSYKSLMIFHLRQHLKDTYWCDFCNVALPEGATSWVEKDGHIITNIDLDEHTVAEMQDEIVQHEEETNDSGAKQGNGSDTSMLPKSMDLMITVMPVDAEDVDRVVQQEAVIGPEMTEPGGRTEETVQLLNENSKSISSLHHVQSISNSSKQIRVLNEMGMIVTQEVGTGEGRDSGTVMTEESTDSQFPYQTTDCSTVGLTVGTLGDANTGLHILNKCLVDSNCSKDSALKELGLNMKHTGSRQFRVLNEMGMIEVTSVESTEQLLIDNLNSDTNEMRVNVTPGMMTYSNNDRRLNLSLVDNSSELNEEGLGVCK
jgi:hypothetical protein